MLNRLQDINRSEACLKCLQYVGDDGRTVIIGGSEIVPVECQWVAAWFGGDDDVYHATLHIAGYTVALCDLRRLT